MAAKSVYNERFSFEDPGSSQSASRSTIYRKKKGVRQQVDEASPVPEGGIREEQTECSGDWQKSTLR